MSARGWLAYPVTPAPIEVALPSTADSGNNPASDVRNADALSVNPGPRPGL